MPEFVPQSPRTYRLPVRILRYVLARTSPKFLLLLALGLWPFG